MRTVPAQLWIGDDWSWSASFPDTPAPTWTLTYHFENAGYSAGLAASAAGTEFAFAAAAAVTALFKAGSYHYSARLTNGSLAKTLEEGWVDVLTNASASGSKDWRSPEQVALDNIREFIADPNSIRAASYSIQGRSLARIPFHELLDIRDRLQRDVEGQRNGSRRILVRANRG